MLKMASALTGGFGGGFGPIIAARAVPTSGSNANIITEKGKGFLSSCEGI